MRIRLAAAAAAAAFCFLLAPGGVTAVRVGAREEDHGYAVHQRRAAGRTHQGANHSVVGKFAGECLGPCQGNPQPGPTCKCQCSGLPAPLALDEARILAELDLFDKDRSVEAEGMTDWTQLCTAIERFSNYKDSSTIVKDAAVGTVLTWQWQLAGMNMTIFTGGLKRLVQALQSMAHKGLRLNNLKKCVSGIKNAAGLVAKGKVWIGWSCKEARNLFIKTLGSVVAVSLVVMNTDLLTGAIEALVDGLLFISSGDWVITGLHVLKQLLGSVPMLGMGVSAQQGAAYALSCVGWIMAKVYTSRKVMKTSELIADFIWQFSHKLFVKRKLKLAEARSQQVQQCLSELPDCREGMDCGQMEQGCRSMIDGQLAVHGECGLTLENGGTPQGECDIYGPVGQVPQGAFAKSIGWKLFSQGLRACDVIQEMSYKEGGTFPLPHMMQKWLGVEEKSHSLAVPDVSALERWIDKEKRYNMDMSMGPSITNAGGVGYSDDVGYVVSISGMMVDPDALPEFKWIPFGPIDGFRVDDIACTPTPDSADESADEMAMKQVVQQSVADGEGADQLLS